MAGGEADKPRSKPSPTKCSVTSRPYPGEKDKVSVVETGFSVDRDSQGRHRISYGAVLRNESPDLVAGRLQVYVRFRKAPEGLVKFREEPGSDPVEEIGFGDMWLGPGERLGIGDSVTVTDPAGGKLPDIEVKVSVFGGGWFTTCAFVRHRVEVNEIEVKQRGGADTATIGLTVRMPCPDKDLTSDFARLQAVYHDAAGKVAGGDVLDFPDPDPGYHQDPDPYRVATTAHIPKDADPSRTKVYSLAGCVPPDDSPTG
ncbi:MAG: hypothetical protein ACRDTU_05030 [Micromonosporaceae bacterium]